MNYIRTKVEMNNYGLAKEDGELLVNYSLKQKGRMGLNGLPEQSNVITDNFRKESISLKSVNTAFCKNKRRN
jgi:hypothetical protein